ncbi:hypothetical protein SAMN05443661_13338 [Natronobacterium gregoryi]|uniref:Uncharacterized protein n=2 Tax=Natronobacterium gregoryi TaxID=44930 RepID=L0AJY3_NATGS|nr:hypothetical protein Natgr_2608 [Natronobacterium gregoryi SP2]SFJ48680.1 hypothetical protein SAMN05443661_13338 [Natronobacterium gregoryi]
MSRESIWELVIPTTLPKFRFHGSFLPKVVLSLYVSVHF